MIELSPEAQTSVELQREIDILGVSDRWPDAVKLLHSDAKLRSLFNKGMRTFIAEEKERCPFTRFSGLYRDPFPPYLYSVFGGGTDVLGDEQICDDTYLGKLTELFQAHGLKGGDNLYEQDGGIYDDIFFDLMVGDDRRSEQFRWKLLWLNIQHGYTRDHIEYYQLNDEHGVHDDFWKALFKKLDFNGKVWLETTTPEKRAAAYEKLTPMRIMSDLDHKMAEACAAQGVPYELSQPRR